MYIKWSCASTALLFKSLIPGQQQHNQAVLSFWQLASNSTDWSTRSHPWDTFQLHLHPTPAPRAQGLPVTQRHPSPCQNATGDSHPLSSSEIQSLQVPVKSPLDVRNTQHRELGAAQKSSWPTQNKKHQQPGHSGILAYCINNWRWFSGWKIFSKGGVI